MSRPPTLRQLRYFLALVRHAHFGRAAEECNVSQSAFSIAIRELEKLLDIPLVDRTSKQVTITATGREVAALARNCLVASDELVEFARSENEPLARRVNLGVIPTIAPFILPPLMPELARRFPRMKLFLREETTERLLDALLDGSLDLLLIALPWDTRNAAVLHLFRDPFLLAARKGSRLLRDAPPGTPELAADSVLLLDDGHCLRDHAIKACRLTRPDKLQRFAASSLQTLVQMVNADLGITFLPAMALGSSLLAGTDIVTRELGPRAAREIGLVWREGSARAAEFRSFGEAILDCRAAPGSAIQNPATGHAGARNRSVAKK